MLLTAGTLPGRSKSLGDYVVKLSRGHNPTGGFQVWNVADGKLLFRATDLLRTATDVSFSPDGKTVAVGYGDWRRRGEIAIFDLTAGKIVATLRGHSGWVRQLAHSPTGKTLISCGSITPGSEVTGGEVWIWNLEKSTGDLAWKHEVSTISSVAYSSDGTCFVAGGGDLKRHTGLLLLWDAELNSLKHEMTDSYGSIDSLTFSPDGMTLVTGSDRGGFDAGLDFWDFPDTATHPRPKYQQLVSPQSGAYRVDVVFAGRSTSGHPGG